MRPELLSPEAVVLALPLVEQDELYECGLAAITALCRYHGIELAESVRTSLAATAKEKEGLSGGELRDALAQAGLEVFLFEGTLARGTTGLYDHIDRGRPLLVLTSPDGRRHHYLLVIGYDPRPEDVVNLVLFDPSRGQVLVPSSAFERDWERTSRFTLLAVPASGGAPGS
jgi:ABC-type bacteriocin/lantibiotic exporter with double-glycine peptidase domain